MKNYRTFSAGLLASAALMLAVAPVAAETNIGTNIGVPGVIVQPQPVYVQPRPTYVRAEYENDWRERQARAIAWRDNPRNHGQAVSAAAHERNDERKKNHHHQKKHHH